MAEPTAPKISTSATETAALPALVATPISAPAAPTVKPFPRKRLAAVVLVAIAVGGLAWWQPWVARVPQVVIETVAEGPVARILAVNGRVAALQSVDVRPAVPGQLAEVHVAVGDVVTAGDVMARLDTTQPAAQVAQSFAAFDAGLVQLQQAQEDAGRDRALGDNIPRQTLATAELAVTAAAAEVARLQALLDQSQAQLEHFTIAAPMSGTVLARAAEPGQVVDGVTVLFTVANVRDLVVEADVDETYATRMQLGLPVHLQLTGDEAILPGTVTYVAPVVDPDTGGLAIKMTPVVPNPAPIGLTVTANIVMDAKPMGITAPRSAILTEADQSVLFVVVDGKAERRVVTIIPWPAVRLEVTDGLAAGDMLILDPTGLTDGQAVTLADKTALP